MCLFFYPTVGSADGRLAEDARGRRPAKETRGQTEDKREGFCELSHYLSETAKSKWVNVLRFPRSTVRSVRRGLEENPGRIQSGRLADRLALWEKLSLGRRLKTKSWS